MGSGSYVSTYEMEFFQQNWLQCNRSWSYLQTFYMNNDLNSYKFDVKVFIVLYLGSHVLFLFLYMPFLKSSIPVFALK